ncbi:hypothetical protein Glove_168g170 [Diversispora epigaea]|uniref:Uncharacterized protein n=1 Tax=Diversispora epigaea TaxID=1348612 RepID=A0A397IU98_9GLOM|nr:hypothetical protein Glove_168g170 [Diversispora epigaea]
MSSAKAKRIQIRRQFEQLPKNIQEILHHVNIDGTKLVNECEQNSKEAKERLKLILMEIDYIHLYFNNKSEGKLLKITRDLLRPFRNKFMKALVVFTPKQEEVVGTKRKRIIIKRSGDTGNKRAKYQ